MKILKRWFTNRDKDEAIQLSSHDNGRSFVLRIDNVKIGILTYVESAWRFSYSDEFRNQDKFRRIVGFSDTNKEYVSSQLWPFFRLRIPGLKQPLVREILEREQIDSTDEFSLLEKFGRESISNPYILDPC